MKRLILLCAVLVAGCVLLAQTPRTVTLAWDANNPADQVTAYRVYEVSGSDLVLVAEVPGETTVATITVPSAGRRVYVATAVNYWGESDLSNEARTPPAGQAPKNLKLD